MNVFILWFAKMGIDEAFDKYILSDAVTYEL
jgi:hypothetical protein